MEGGVGRRNRSFSRATKKGFKKGRISAIQWREGEALNGVGREDSTVCKG